MVAALDSKSSLVRGGSSSLPPGTNVNNLIEVFYICAGEQAIHIACVGDEKGGSIICSTEQIAEPGSRKFLSGG